MSSIPRSPGIYQILCATTQKYYIGSSRDLWWRWQEHRKLLRGNRHPNPHLQRAWNNYGEDDFTFAVVELTPLDRLVEREQYWIDRLSACDDRYGFNMAPVARSVLGIKRSPESRAKMAEAARNRSAEVRENMAAAQRGKTLSPEHRAKLADAIQRRDPEVQARFHAAAPGKGHIKSPETRAKISENNRNRSPGLLARIGKRISEAMQNVPDEVKEKRHAPLSPEVKAKMSAAAQNRSPEYRDKMSVAKRKENLTPETREKLRQAALNREARKRGK